MKYAAVREVKRLLDQIMALTEWKAAEVFANDTAKVPCGILIGDAKFFEMMSSTDDE